MDIKRLATDLLCWGIVAASIFGFLYWASGQVGN